MASSTPVHPLGTRARILFSSVFGPYAQDDAYGSRSINPMELYHNQVTRVQGPFSLRMFHRSFGLMFIQANIEAPCTLLDFPSLDRFVEEIKTRTYDVVGISSIIPNIGKAKKMCELVRTYQPQATIVIGGHIANIPDLHSRIDVDHIVRGDGVRWFRSFLGQDLDAPIKHPPTTSAFGTRTLGFTLPDRPGETAATLIPSVGCPMGCNFCSTSTLFGGKGRFVSFFETGDELFSVLCELEERLKVRSFFVLDENFLLHKKRALQLLERMRQHNKSWSFYVFSSAAVIRSYSIEQLVALGISWVWMGLEGEKSQYKKLRNVDTRELVRNLQSHGICVLGSTIIGLENHTPGNIDDVIDYAVSHDTDFHQFMLYTPLPGTPFYEQQRVQGTLLNEDELSAADTHGQYRFNYRHRHIPAGMETQFLLKAFRRDFEQNGPSLARMFRTKLLGWKRYKNHPDDRVRDRIEWEASGIKTQHAASLWAMRAWYRGNAPMRRKLGAILADIYREFGLHSRLAAPLLGSVLYGSIFLEARRLARGWTYEPQSAYEKNARALELEKPALEGTWIAGRIAAAELAGRGILKIRSRSQAEGHHPLVVDLHGAFDSLNAVKLKKHIEDYLKEHTGSLALNFSGVTAIESEALLGFLKKLSNYQERIKIVSIDSLKAEMAEVVQYARQYFDVFADEHGLAASLA